MERGFYSRHRVCVCNQLIAFYILALRCVFGTGWSCCLMLSPSRPVAVRNDTWQVSSLRSCVVQTCFLAPGKGA